MIPKRLPATLLLLATLSVGSIHAQVALPREFGPIRLRMRASELQPILPDTTDQCADDCIAGEQALTADFAGVPGLRTALVALGLDSSTSFAQRPGFDLLLFHGQLTEFIFPPPERDLDASVHRMIALLGPWTQITIQPGGHGIIRWRDQRTIVDLEAEAVTVALPDLRHGLATSIRVLDRRADSLRAQAAAREGPRH